MLILILTQVGYVKKAINFLKIALAGARWAASQGQNIKLVLLVCGA